LQLRTHEALAAPARLRSSAQTAQMPLARTATCMQVPPQLTDSLVKACRAAALAPSHACAEGILAEGYGVASVLEQLLERVLAMPDLADTQKAAAAAAMAAADKCLTDGADGFLQLLAVVTVLQQALNGQHK
jgi:replication factor C subunit 2/4